MFLFYSILSESIGQSVRITVFQHLESTKGPTSCKYGGKYKVEFCGKSVNLLTNKA